MFAQPPSRKCHGCSPKLMTEVSLSNGEWKCLDILGARCLLPTEDLLFYMKYPLATHQLQMMEEPNKEP